MSLHKFRAVKYWSPFRRRVQFCDHALRWHPFCLWCGRQRNIDSFCGGKLKVKTINQATIRSLGSTDRQSINQSVTQSFRSMCVRVVQGTHGKRITNVYDARQHRWVRRMLLVLYVDWLSSLLIGSRVVEDSRSVCVYDHCLYEQWHTVVIGSYTGRWKDIDTETYM